MTPPKGLCETGIFTINTANSSVEIPTPAKLNTTARIPNKSPQISSENVDKYQDNKKELRMSMIERYKKKGGFIQLLNLIETTGTEKREKFLKLIAEESTAWEAEIRKKMVTLDRILSWPQPQLAEVLPRINAMTLGALISSLPPEKQAVLMAILSFSEKRKIEEFLKDKKPNPGEAGAAYMKLVSEIRSMVASGHLKFEKFDEELVIPENIEELLNGAKAPMMSKKEVNAAVAQFEPVPAGLAPNVAEELTQLRKKIVMLSQDNVKLQQENHQMKDKLDQIKKIA